MELSLHLKLRAHITLLYVVLHLEKIHQSLASDLTSLELNYILPIRESVTGENVNMKDRVCLPESLITDE